MIQNSWAGTCITDIIVGWYFGSLSGNLEFCLDCEDVEIKLYHEELYVTYCRGPRSPSAGTVMRCLDIKFERKPLCRLLMLHANDGTTWSSCYTIFHESKWLWSRWNINSKQLHIAIKLHRYFIVAKQMVSLCVHNIAAGSALEIKVVFNVIDINNVSWYLDI